MERLPPYNLEAEKSVIGSIIADNGCLYDVLEIISEDDFYNPEHIRIFEAITELSKAKQPIDIVTVSEKAKDTFNTLVDCMNNSYTSANVKHHAEIVAEKSKLRKLILASQEVISKSYESEDSAEPVAIFEKVLQNISNKIISGVTEFKKCFENQWQIYEERMKSKGKIQGIATGYADFDYYLNGLKDGNFYILAARPAMGKTALALGIASNVGITQRKKVALFSLEMTTEQLMDRIISNHTNIDNKRLQSGNLNGDEIDELGQSMVISDSPIFIDDTAALKLKQIFARCRRIKNTYGLDLVIVDYLQLIQGNTKTNNREQEVAEISRGLKIMAKELLCPVICLSQLSRSCETRNDKRPMLSDLRESGSIEQDADGVIFIYRDDYYNPESNKKNVAEIIFAKNRFGSTGTVELAWIGQYTKFANLERWNK